MRKVIASTLLFLWAGAHAGIDAERKDEILYMLKHDCGSCHGMTLRGGLGPPLTPQALHGRSRALMVETILQGRAGTPMPPWKPMLSRDEVKWLVDVLYEGKTNEP